ncbi:hypothetical protein CRUP_028173 [Coryphaenoides rupestris]|nr:hypothetical protein CRUP_028173 [Coryphaenoides rupestris]
MYGTTRNAILRGTFSEGFVAIVQGHMDEMWGLATHPSQNVFLTCGHDRQVCLWNTEEHKLDWCTSLEEYGLCADFCPNGSVVSVGLSTGSERMVAVADDFCKVHLFQYPCTKLKVRPAVP